MNNDIKCHKFSSPSSRLSRDLIKATARKQSCQKIFHKIEFEVDEVPLECEIIIKVHCEKNCMMAEWQSNNEINKKLTV